MNPFFMPEMLKEFLVWRNSVDVLLIAAGLFFLYRTLRRLGTWKIVAGIVVAMLIFLLARVLDLNGIRWIYSNLSNVVIIALIVIFQPELRKIFERAVSVRRSEISDPGDELSGMLAEALFAMARRKQGSIIVFPGKEPIREYLSGGYPLNARPSHPLLMSIFDPNSPGHDGALVISSGLLSEFAVRLPISVSASLPEEYGTRHHAAMALAEKTDALITVVSEERGIVSIFHMGRMKRAGGPQDIVNALQSHWKSTSSFPFELGRGETRRSIAFQLAASLALAVFFWGAIIFSQREFVERGYTVPVEYSATATDLTLVGKRQQEMHLYLGGTKSRLDALDPSNLNVKIDISKFKPGTQSVFITSDHIALPKGVELIEAVPANLELTLAQVSEQWAKITPQLVGDLPADIKIGSVDLSPEQVRVISPSPNDKGKPLNVTTTPIYLENITRDTKILCKIIAPQTVQPVSKQWPDVEVSIQVIRVLH